MYLGEDNYRTSRGIVLNTRYLLVLLALSLLSRLHAQDTITLQAVEVTARQSAQHMPAMSPHKFDTLVLQNQSTSSLSQLLIQHSPVFIKTYGPGGISTASFRGTTASHTLVLWNDFQLNGASLGQVDFSTIPVYMVDDISLSPGANSSKNSGGLGGIVNIDNKSSFGKGVILDIKQSIGSFLTTRSYLTTGYSGRKISFKIKGNFNASKNNFPYENTAVIPQQRMRQSNAAYREGGVMPELHLLLGNGVISLVSWNQWNDRELPPIMPNVGNTNTIEWTKDAFSRNYISYRTFWTGGNLTVKSACFIEKQHYFLEVRSLPNEHIITAKETDNNSLVLHQIAEVNQDLFRSWKMNVKLQWDKEQVESNQYEGSKKRDVVSTYASAEGDIYKTLSGRVSLRADWIDGSSMGVFPTACVSYQMPFVPELALSVGYSHNYRNPSMNDLYWNPGGNENLKSEDGKTIDLKVSLEHKGTAWSFDATAAAYYSRVKDWIQWVPTSYRYWVPENVSEVCARGVELHLDIKRNIERCELSLSGNYVFTRTSDESDKAQQLGKDGRQLIYIPKHHGNMFFNCRYEAWNMSYVLEVTGKRSTSYSESSYYSNALPAYAVHNIALGWTKTRYKIEARCNNFTNKSYQNVAWRPMPGINWELSLEYKL